MRKKMIIRFCAAIITIVWSVSDAKEIKYSEKELHQFVVSFANDMNKQLPMFIDKETRVDSVIPYKKTFIYMCSLPYINYDEFNYSEIKVLKEKELVNNVCTNKSMSMLAKQHGYSFVWVYYDKTGKELIRFSVDGKKCGK